MPAPIGSAATSFAATLQRADATVDARVGTGLDATGTTGPQRAAPGGLDFAERVREVLDEANAHQVRATEASEAYANGDRNDIHGTMIALEQADVTFRLVSSIRSRLVEAYREVMRMGA